MIQQGKEKWILSRKIGYMSGSPHEVLFVARALIAANQAFSQVGHLLRIQHLFQQREPVDFHLQ